MNHSQSLFGSQGEKGGGRCRQLTNVRQGPSDVLRLFPTCYAATGLGMSKMLYPQKSVGKTRLKRFGQQCESRVLAACSTERALFFLAAGGAERVLVSTFAFSHKAPWSLPSPLSSPIIATSRPPLSFLHRHEGFSVGLDLHRGRTPPASRSSALGSASRRNTRRAVHRRRLLCLFGRCKACRQWVSPFTNG